MSIESNLVIFGQRVRHLRERAGMSLGQVASEADIPKTWLSRLENGRQKLDPYHLKDWERVLMLVRCLQEWCVTRSDPRDAYCLVSLLGRPPTLEYLRQMCPDVEDEILQQQAWLTRPSTVPLLKQPLVVRQAEWDWLRERLIPPGRAGGEGKTWVGPKVDVAVTGAPGSGKSTLSQMFGGSQETAAHFPDGTLYASQQTADARVWLAEWADLYGIDLPAKGHAVLWRDALRARLKGLSVLLIIDDARDRAFAEALLVAEGEQSRAVVVTRQPGLVEALGVAPGNVLNLGVMTAEQGVELLRANVTDHTWSEKDESAAREVVSLLGGAPHAISAAARFIQGVNASARPQRWAGMLKRLGAGRLDALASTREMYDLVYGELGTLQVAYRALGTCAWGAPVEDGLVATVLDVSQSEAHRVMRDLVGRGLVTEACDDEMRTWYQVHQLIGEHAGSLVGPGEREAWAKRHAYYHARLLLSPADSDLWRDVPTGLPHVDNLRHAMAWCAGHLDTLERMTLAQAIYLGASGRVALAGGLEDVLPLGQALSECAAAQDRSQGLVSWTHGQVLLDAEQAAQAGETLERGAKLLEACGDWPATVACALDGSGAYHQAGDKMSAKRLVDLANGCARQHYATIRQQVTEGELDRVREDRQALRRVNAIIEMPDKLSPLTLVSIRRMCVLGAQQMAREIRGRSVVKRRPAGRLPWTDKDFIYALTFYQVAGTLWKEE